MFVIGVWNVVFSALWVDEVLRLMENAVETCNIQNPSGVTEQSLFLFLRVPCRARPVSGKSCMYVFMNE